MGKMKARAAKRLASLLAVTGLLLAGAMLFYWPAGPASVLQASLQPREAGSLIARDAGPTAEWVGSTPQALGSPEPGKDLALVA